MLRLKVLIGKGNTIVELCSVEIALSVWNKRAVRLKKIKLRAWCFFLFFCLAKDQASNEQKRNRNSMTCEVVCFFFLQNIVLENEQLWLVILFVCGGEGNRNWGHAMLKLSGWISTSSIGCQPIALVGSPRLDSERINFAKKITVWWGHGAISLKNSWSRGSYYKALGTPYLSILWRYLLGTICEEKWQRGRSRIVILIYKIYS